MYRQNNGGFSMIEVIVSTALLLVVTLGFITAAAAGGKALLEGMKLESSWTEEELLAEEGSLKESLLKVYFTIEDQEEGDTMEAVEVFEEYRTPGSGEDYYRHR